ncbi:hypothetical protein E2C01_094952 [Portunus trituberculatus]|uniref:Uncharacterized protein n=1 Tax=Portunus trituberculatus TaxID=210409 RepID=A0A5B7JTV5_PORTR|nr:hypothetical protein [Portunus trituberculatus]
MLSFTSPSLSLCRIPVSYHPSLPFLFLSQPPLDLTSPRLAPPRLALPRLASFPAHTVQYSRRDVPRPNSVGGRRMGVARGEREQQEGGVCVVGLG